MGRILVVDDQATQRKKIELAVSGLGYDVETTASAAQAMSHLKHNPVDMVLLDIEMPEADGFSVLNWLSQQPAFKHIPVIVISAHESDRSQVIKAIQMGANDFLPKNFPRPVLQARIKAGLLVKKNRDAEIEMTHQIERLTRASELLENSIYNPKQLQLNTIASGASSMANFASVFSDMAQKIYDRERRLKHAAQTIRGFGLLLLTGLLFGLEAPIAKWINQFDLNSIGMAIWLNAVTVVLTIPIAIYKKDLPKPSLNVISYFLLWGFFTVILGDFLLLKASEHIEASVIIIIMVTEVLMVYAYSAIMRLESTSTKKVSGVLLGIIGVVLAVYAQRTSDGSTNILWAILAIGVPLGYAGIDIMAASSRNVQTSPQTTLGLASLAGIIIMLPIAWNQDGYIPLNAIPPAAAIGLIVWGVVVLFSMLAFVKLTLNAGPVFASQTAYIQTIGGITISVFFLQESLTPTVLMALVIIIIGMLLVEPKREPEEVLSAEDLEILMNRNAEM